MLAVGMAQGKQGVHVFEIPKPEINSRFGGMLSEMITHRFRLENYQQAFALSDPKHIKAVIEVEPWD